MQFLDDGFDEMVLRVLRHVPVVSSTVCVCMGAEIVGGAVVARASVSFLHLFLMDIQYI